MAARSCVASSAMREHTDLTGARPSRRPARIAVVAALAAVAGATVAPPPSSATTESEVTAIVSAEADWSSSGGQSQDAHISADGRFVVFTSTSFTLAPGVPNTFRHVYMHDLWTDEKTLDSGAKAKFWNKIHWFEGYEELFPTDGANGRRFYAWHESAVGQVNNKELNSRITYENIKTAWLANNWMGMALDTEKGIVYAPTGSAAFDFYGGNRKGDNLFANCLLALDANTGKRLWHFQTVHHDIWDRDIPAPPNLFTLTHNGQ